MTFTAERLLSKVSLESLRTRLRRRFSFPLLAKELTEAAARRRTFVIRVAYVVLLYGVFVAMVPKGTFGGVVSISQVLGAGRGMFDTLCFLQFAGVALFLPALMAGRIAQEKERESLVLLLLTELRPGQIILQKYLGGLVPMLSFLLLALPLSAIAYSLGGLTSAQLLRNAAVILIVTLQIGAIALFCSVWCRSTASAFLGSYLVGAIFYGGPPLVWELVQAVVRVWHPTWWTNSDYSTILIPLTLRPSPWRTFLVHSAPSILSIFVFLALARFFLVRRAFLPASNVSLRLFRWLDGVMQRANRHIGNVTLWRDKVSLPGKAPIYWRETTRRTLGKAHYLIRILVLVELPTVMLCGLFTLDGPSYNGQAYGLTALLALLMALAVLGISVQAANTIVTERVQQTLEVLLTTPLAAREIVLQKAQALRRLMLVAAIPLATVMGVECSLERGVTSRDVTDSTDGLPAYLVSAAIILGIFLPMVSWLSMWVGLKMRTRFAAIITALAIIAAWCFVPIGLYIYSETHFGQRNPFTQSALLFSPLALGALNEDSDIHSMWKTPENPLRAYTTMYNPRARPRALFSPWPFILANVALYGSVTLLLRHHVLKNADRWLRR